MFWGCSGENISLYTQIFVESPVYRKDNARHEAAALGIQEKQQSAYKVFGLAVTAHGGWPQRS